MKENSDLHEYFARLSRQLNENDLSLVDFDVLQERLQQLSEESSVADNLADECAILRNDCQQRLTGMIKAIAAVDRKRDGYETALAAIEELSCLTAADLLKKYRQVAARFRDCFPTSFSALRTSAPMTLNRSQVRNLK